MGSKHINRFSGRIKCIQIIFSAIVIILIVLSGTPSPAIPLLTISITSLSVNVIILLVRLIAGSEKIHENVAKVEFGFSLVWAFLHCIVSYPLILLYELGVQACSVLGMLNAGFHAAEACDRLTSNLKVNNSKLASRHISIPRVDPPTYY